MQEFSVPATVVRDIWNMHHFDGLRVQAIKQNIQTKYAIDLQINRIKYIIKMVDGWKKETLGKARYYEIGITRKEWLNQRVSNQPIDMINTGRGRGGRGGNQWIPQTNLPVAVPASLIFKEKKTKRTQNDVIKIIMAADCEYCNYSKENGTYGAVLDKVKKKYEKKYHIIEVETIGNPIDIFKNPETREIAMFFITSMGEIPAIFDIYFPGFFMQSTTHGVTAQFRLGIHIKLLFQAIDLIHTRRLWPAPFAYLPPPYHTSKFMDVFGLSIKKGFRSVMKGGDN